MRRAAERAARSDSSTVRVLEVGESSLISRHISELEITLYRPASEGGKHLLFFDTTACLFSESGGQTDYVGVGRTTTNNKALLHQSHVVLKAEDVTDVTSSLLEPSESIPVLPGDGLLVRLKRVTMASGLSVCSTLFSNESEEIKGVYYAVKKPRAALPLMIIPVTITPPRYCSCLALMIRKVKVNNEANWEVVRVDEVISSRDVKGVVTALQSRGLVDPASYCFDPSRRLDNATDGSADSGSSCDDDDDDLETSIDEDGCDFESLLVNVPRVAREARRQYNVGRSALNAVLEDGDSSDNDEVTKDALRAVVPRYTSACAVRYEEGTYNVGSRADSLATHYVTHREEYGINNAASNFGKPATGVLPILASSASAPHQRLSYAASAFERPPVPTEFLAVQTPSLRRKSGVGHGRRHGRSPGPRGFSQRRRGRRGNSLESIGSAGRSRGKSRKSVFLDTDSSDRSRSSNRKGKKGRGKRKSASPGKRRKSGRAKRKSSSKSKKRMSRSRSRSSSRSRSGSRPPSRSPENTNGS